MSIQIIFNTICMLKHLTQNFKDLSGLILIQLHMFYCVELLFLVTIAYIHYY